MSKRSLKRIKSKKSEDDYVDVVIEDTESDDEKDKRTPEQKRLDKLESRYEKVLNSFNKLVYDHDRLNKLTMTLGKLIEKHDKALGEQNNLLENVEGTLTNVLLAIRQNEYLQSWYPEQQGHKEMKVTGHHPYSYYGKKATK